MSAAVRSLLSKLPVGGSAGGTTQRFHSGAPPHVGWWLTAGRQARGLGAFGWRWWNGAEWSMRALEHSAAEYAAMWAAKETALNSDVIYWCHFYPANARVPRVDPRPAWALPSVGHDAGMQSLTGTAAAALSEAAAAAPLHMAADPAPIGSVGWIEVDGKRHYFTQAQKAALLAKMRRGMPLSGHMVPGDATMRGLAALRAAPTKDAFNEAVRDMGPSVAQLIEEGFLQRPSAQAAPGPAPATDALPPNTVRRVPPLEGAETALELASVRKTAALLTHPEAFALRTELARLRGCAEPRSAADIQAAVEADFKRAREATLDAAYAPAFRQPGADLHQEQAERKATAQATGSPVADVGAAQLHPVSAKENATLLRRADECLTRGIQSARLVTITPLEGQALQQELARLRACEDELKIAREAALARFTQGAKDGGKLWSSGYGVGYRNGQAAYQAQDDALVRKGVEAALMPHFQAARARIDAAAQAGESVQLSVGMVSAMSIELARLQALLRTTRRDLIKATDEANAWRPKGI